MKIIFLSLASIISLSLFSCKSKKQSNTVSEIKTETNTTNTNQRLENGSYRLIVSFISIGTGVDGEAYNKLEKFIKEHPKSPSFEQKRWGREGEVDFMFTLKEFKANEQLKFISDLKVAIGKSDRVLYKENEKSR
jgi:hypothetical protein